MVLHATAPHSPALIENPLNLLLKRHGPACALRPLQKLSNDGKVRIYESEKHMERSIVSFGCPWLFVGRVWRFVECVFVSQR